MPVEEYLKWHNQPTIRELLDAHLSTIICVLTNTNSKKKVKVEDIMLTLTKQDKKDKLTNDLKSEFLSRFKTVIKK